MSPLRVVVFLSVVLGITFAAHRYFWARLVRDPALPAPFFRIATAVIIALGLTLPLAMTLVRLFPAQRNAVWVWLSYLWMGTAFYLLVSLGLGDLVRALMRWFGSSRAPQDEGRRVALARMTALVTGGVALSAAAVSTWLALRRVQVRPVDVALKRLPASLSGYTIVQLTDVHVGPTIGSEFLEEIVADANAQNPDLVVITGDLIDGPVDVLGPLLAPLRKLRARDGVFFVTGNHEYFYDANAWCAFLPSLGIRVLRNEHVTLRPGLDLAGVDDVSARQISGSGGADLDAALLGRNPSNALILLAHQPKVINAAAAAGVDLQLSGHTHGGQMAPFNFLVRLQQPYVAGLHQQGPTQIYVSRGTGYWGPPMRLGAPAEVTRVVLRSSEPALRSQT